MPKFIFDLKTQRYRLKSGRSAGQFISDERARALTRDAIAYTIADTRTVGSLLVEGKISVSTWEKETAKAIKQLTIQQYLLGIGGEKRMTPTDYGRLGQKLKEQYQYLRGFSQDLINGGMSESQFYARLELYLNATRGGYELARAESHVRSGFKWERRIRTKTESCGECVTYAALSWQPIHSLPNPTERCSCRVNCGCYKEFAKEKPQDGLRWWNQSLIWAIARAI